MRNYVYDPTRSRIPRGPRPSPMVDRVNNRVLSKDQMSVIRDREKASIIHKALPGRNPVDLGRPIDKTPGGHWVSDVETTASMITNGNCVSRECCLDYAIELKFKAIDCRQCKHFAGGDHERKKDPKITRGNTRTRNAGALLAVLASKDVGVARISAQNNASGIGD